MGQGSAERIHSLATWAPVPTPEPREHPVGGQIKPVHHTRSELQLKLREPCGTETVVFLIEPTREFVGYNIENSLHMHWLQGNDKQLH